MPKSSLCASGGDDTTARVYGDFYRTSIVTMPPLGVIDRGMSVTEHRKRLARCTRPSLGEWYAVTDAHPGLFAGAPAPTGERSLLRPSSWGAPPVSNACSGDDSDGTESDSP